MLATLFLIAICAGWFFMGYRNGYDKAAKKALMLEASDISNIIPVYIAEYEEGSYYLYDKNTSHFICQGKTLEEVGKALNNAKKYFAIVAMQKGSDIELQWYIKGKFSEIQ